jgi:hypothetical protein
MGLVNGSIIFRTFLSGYDVPSRVFGRQCSWKSGKRRNLAIQPIDSRAKRWFVAAAMLPNKAMIGSRPSPFLRLKSSDQWNCFVALQPQRSSCPLGECGLVAKIVSSASPQSLNPMSLRFVFEKWLHHSTSYCTLNL